MDIKIEDNTGIAQEKKGGFWKKFLIVLLVLFFVIFFLVVYARYKATSGLRVYEYKVTNDKLPDNFHGVKVVHLSDIYFGNTTTLNALESVVNEINNLKPDIVVFTGDLGNINNDDKQNIIAVLSNINYTIGKYAVRGDTDNELFDDIITNSGFVNLTDTSNYVYYKGDRPILISGINEVYDGFSILLLHEPDKVDNFNGFSLVLAGHSLNGQINLPLIKNLFLMDGCKKYYDKYYKVNDSEMYISSGIGTTNFKYRFNNKPSINLYRITKY